MRSFLGLCLRAGRPGEKEGASRSSPRLALPDPCDLTSTPGHTPGPGSVPFTCTTTCEGAAADGSPPVPTPRRGGVQGSGGRSGGQGEGVVECSGRRGGAGHTGGRKTGRSGVHKWRGTQTVGRGGGWLGAPGTAGVRGGGEERRRGRAHWGGAGPAHCGGRVGGWGPQRFQNALEGGAEPKKTSARQLPPGRFRFRLVARLRPGLSRLGPLGFPLCTRTLSRRGVHDPEISSRDCEESRPRVARRGTPRRCPQLSAPRPPGSPWRVGASEGPPAVPAPGRMEGRGCSRGITQQAREGLGVLPGFISVASAP
uniref:Uncharacterized protein n=1 Tax=Rangifer tarandus platyrhynchus TaxID=3082113 RepID=A0ACB0E5T5_RANTA|nr:unnamed protein product [Rangifer tarandus platyrhynchus]